MHYRQLGSTGLTASILGIGSSPFRQGSPEICAQLLEQAVEMGITYYDTAHSYVNGQETIGCLPPLVRNELVIATKTGGRGGKVCLEHLQHSIRTMKRSWIDVWMTHMIQTEEEYEMCTDLGGFCDIAQSARQAGIVRATGASFHAPTNVILRAIEERAFDVVMFQLNLIGRETVFGSSIASYRELLLPAAEANGVGVVVMKVLAGGEMQHGAPPLAFLSGGDDPNGVSSAIRYITMHPGIGVAVVGMANTAELMQNVAAVERIDDSKLAQFHEWTSRMAEIDQGECTRCGECIGVCPEGIEIPKVLRMHDQFRFFGMEPVARAKYSQLEVNASACVTCRKCQEVCPENFDIGASLNLAHQTLAV